MVEDELLRASLLILFALVVPVAGYYRARAHAQPEQLDRMQEGLPILIGIRFFSLLSLLGLVAYLIDPALMRWSSIDIPLVIRFFGIAIGTLGGVLWVYTFHHLGLNLTDTVVTRENATLVTTGPYRYVRHPFYIALLMIAVANGLATANWFIFLGTFIVFVLLYQRTSKEELKLIEKFGDAYRTYMTSTGRFFPKL